MSIELNDAIRAAVNGALEAGNPALLAVVTAGGAPRLSYRGSLQVLSADQLGFWARNAEGSTMEAIGTNPQVALMYRDPSKRIMLQFTGRARLAADEAERTLVYDAAPEREQRSDPERKGVGVIIDLDAVEGMLGLGEDGKPNRVKLTR